MVVENCTKRRILLAISQQEETFNKQPPLMRSANTSRLAVVLLQACSSNYTYSMHTYQKTYKCTIVLFLPSSHLYKLCAKLCSELAYSRSKNPFLVYGFHPCGHFHLGWHNTTMYFLLRIMLRVTISERLPLCNMHLIVTFVFTLRLNLKIGKKYRISSIHVIICGSTYMYIPRTMKVVFKLRN